jgi:1-acyl-sn-glycerol-3-phosphate acyltransferase
VNSLVYNGATLISKYLLLPAYASIRVRGLENVPPSGPLLIASNHLNDADPGIICTRIRRPIVFLAKVELFRVPLLGRFLRAFGSVPVRRGEADLAALRYANEALKQGLAVCVFPEGTRAGRPERLGKAHPGVAIIALRNDVPVLPIAITGSGRLGLPLMFLRPYQRAHVTLTIGEPFHLPKPQRLNGEAAEAGTRLIMERVAALLPPGNRGYYGVDTSTGPTAISVKATED